MPHCIRFCSASLFHALFKYIPLHSALLCYNAFCSIMSQRNMFYSSQLHLVHSAPLNSITFQLIPFQCIPFCTCYSNQSIFCFFARPSVRYAAHFSRRNWTEQGCKILSSPPMSSCLTVCLTSCLCLSEHLSVSIYLFFLRLSAIFSISVFLSVFLSMLLTTVSLSLTVSVSRRCLFRYLFICFIPCAWLSVFPRSDSFANC